MSVGISIFDKLMRKRNKYNLKYKTVDGVSIATPANLNECQVCDTFEMFEKQEVFLQDFKVMRSQVLVKTLEDKYQNAENK